MPPLFSNRKVLGFLFYCQKIAIFVQGTLTAAYCHTNASKEHAVYFVGFFFLFIIFISRDIFDYYSCTTLFRRFLRSALFTTSVSSSQRRIYRCTLSDSSRFPCYFEFLCILKVLRTAYWPLSFQIAAHIDNKCPLTLISCPYSQIGCDTKVNYQ